MASMVEECGYEEDYKGNKKYEGEQDKHRH